MRRHGCRLLAALSAVVAVCAVRFASVALRRSSGKSGRMRPDRPGGGRGGCGMDSAGREARPTQEQWGRRGRRTSASMREPATDCSAHTRPRPRTLLTATPAPSYEAR